MGWAAGMILFLSFRSCSHSLPSRKQALVLTHGHIAGPLGAGRRPLNHCGQTWCKTPPKDMVWGNETIIVQPEKAIGKLTNKPCSITTIFSYVAREKWTRGYVCTVVRRQRVVYVIVLVKCPRSTSPPFPCRSGTCSRQWFNRSYIWRAFVFFSFF